MVAKDHEVLDDPERSVLAKGGAILMIEDDGLAFGCSTAASGSTNWQRWGYRHLGEAVAPADS